MTNWTGETVSDGQQIDWLIETDSRDREIVLTADCECGCQLPAQYFTHPEAAFEAADDLTCPEHGLD